MHLDTVFTLLDRDKATAYPKVVDNIRRHQPAARHEAGRLPRDRASRTSSAPSPTPSASTKLQVVETGGDQYQQEREQWDDGNNVVALEPGVVVAYERNTYTIAKMREAGVEVDRDRGLRARQGPRRRPLHDLPAPARPDLRRWRMADVTRRRGSRRWSRSSSPSPLVGLIGYARGDDERRRPVAGAPTSSWSSTGTDAVTAPDRGRGSRGASGAEPPRRAHPDGDADRPAVPHDRPVRHRRHRRPAPGGAVRQRARRRARRDEERLHRSSTIRDSAIGGVSSAMGAIFILLAVGALIGTWNMAGTIPTVVAYGIELLRAGDLLRRRRR